MSKIKILPEILSNKIAAGEVVERPASVVKELVENAIDALSTKVLLEIEKGGRSRIRISDDGVGMRHDDALLSIERYATSKIYKDDDLFSIRTMGFRGEALPSIASVSKFTLVTKNKEDDTGCEIIVEGGKIITVKETGAPVGTLISVEQLFYNTPARRKFLKNVDTEMAHIADTVSAIALAWPSIQFRLLHNGKVIKDWPRTGDHFDRVADILGHDVAPELRRIELNDTHVSVSGWASGPAIHRSSSKKIYTYVNGRLVKDRGIQYALFEGYKGRLMKGQFPVAALFLKVPFNALDVNVHPTKHEVRFAEQKEVYEAVREAVASLWIKSDRSRRYVEKEAADPESPALFTFGQNGIPDQSMVRETQARYAKDEENNTAFIQKGAPSSDDSRQDNFVQTANAPAKTQVNKPFKQSTLWEQHPFADLEVIGQFHQTYILCEAGSELVLIDQHAAHERILFEHLKKKSPSPGSVQKLLMPETLELGYRETVLLAKLIPELKNLGIEIEPFGGNTFVIKSLPALLSDREGKPLILNLLERIATMGFTPGAERAGFENAMDECLILMACHGAIRANQPLTSKEMKALLHQLDGCEIPSHCPHGRPIWIRWPLKDLEKSFHRIV